MKNFLKKLFTGRWPIDPYHQQELQELKEKLINDQILDVYREHLTPQQKERGRKELEEYMGIDARNHLRDFKEQVEINDLVLGKNKEVEEYMTGHCPKHCSHCNDNYCICN